MKINQSLIDDGWRPFPSPFPDECKQGYAKSFEGHADCKDNQRKCKQVQVYYHPEWAFQGRVLPDHWSVELYGKLPDNNQLRLQVGSLYDVEAINRTVATVLSTWDHAVSITPHIEEE